MSTPVEPIVNLHIARVEVDDNGTWTFWNEDGGRISQHLTAGHMAQMYAEIHNELMRQRDITEHFEAFISFAASCRRENTYEWMCLFLDWLNGAVLWFDESAFFNLRGADHFEIQRVERENAG